jgi:hypothetical protein
LNSTNIGLTFDDGLSSIDTGSTAE